MPSFFVRAARIALVGALAAFSLAGCSPAVDVTAAKDAANPACAPMMVSLPDAIGEAQLRKTNSQATAACGGATAPPREPYRSPTL